MRASRSVRRPRSSATAPLTVVLAVLLGLVAVLVTSSPAAAASATIRDGRGDPAGDITRVAVRWFDGLTVRAEHARPLRNGDLYTAFVDTDRSSAGPEYLLFARPNSDELGVRRISSWADRGSAVRCRGLRASADATTDGPVRFFVPGRCLGDPEGAVRVAVRFERESGPGAGRDWAPAARRLGPAVTRG